jgi:glycosyltransferase 2 family protein
VKKKQFVVNLLKYFLGIALLAWVVWRYWESPDAHLGDAIQATAGLPTHVAAWPEGHNPGLGDALGKPIHWQPLLAATAVYLLGILLTFYRWYVLVRAQDLPFTVLASVRLGLIGFFLSTFMPGSVGGDIIKAAFIAREQSRRTVAVATVLVDRAVGLCGLVWLVALIGGVAWFTGVLQQLAKPGPAVAALQTIVTAAIAITFGSFATWFAAGFVSDATAERLGKTIERLPKIGHPLAELWRALHLYRRREGSIAIALLLSMAGHVGFVLAFYFSALTLSPPEKIPTLGANFLIVPVGMMITAGFPAPGGVGGGEFAFGALYHMLGFQPAEGVLASLVQRVITWILGLIGYLVYLRMKPALQPLASTLPAQEATAAG